MPTCIAFWDVQIIGECMHRGHISEALRRNMHVHIGKLESYNVTPTMKRPHPEWAFDFLAGQLPCLCTKWCDTARNVALSE